MAMYLGPQTNNTLPGFVPGYNPFQPVGGSYTDAVKTAQGANTQATDIQVKAYQQAMQEYMNWMQKALDQQRQSANQATMAQLLGAQMGAQQMQQGMVPMQTAALSALQSLPILQKMAGVQAYAMPTSMNVSTPNYINEFQRIMGGQMQQPQPTASGYAQGMENAALRGAWGGQQPAGYSLNAGILSKLTPGQPQPTGGLTPNQVAAIQQDMGRGGMPSPERAGWTNAERDARMMADDARWREMGRTVSAGYAPTVEDIQARAAPITPSNPWGRGVSSSQPAQPFPFIQDLPHAPTVEDMQARAKPSTPSDPWGHGYTITPRSDGFIFDAPSPRPASLPPGVGGGAIGTGVTGAPGGNQSINLQPTNPEVNPQASPLYTWQQQQNTDALRKSLAARGLLSGGAGAQIENEMQRQLSAQESANQYNRVMDLVKIGMGAAGQAGNWSQQMGMIPINLGSGIAGTQMDLGRGMSGLYQGIGGAQMGTTQTIGGMQGQNLISNAQLALQEAMMRNNPYLIGGMNFGMPGGSMYGGGGFAPASGPFTFGRSVENRFF